MLFGGLGVVVWMLALPLWPFVRAGAPPMAPVSALALVILGAGQLLLVHGWRRSTAALGLVVVGLVLWNRLSDYSVQQWFHLALPPGETGRMSVSAGRALGALAIAQVVAALWWPGGWRVAVVFSSAGATVAGISLAADAVAKMADFLWLSRTGMAVPTAWATVLMALAFWQWLRREKIPQPKAAFTALAWFTAAIVAGIMAGRIAWMGNELTAEALRAEERSVSIRQSALMVALQLTRMESHARAYALGREEWLLAGYAQAEQILDTERQRLGQLVRDDEQQRRRWSRLEELVARKRSYILEVLGAIREGRLAAAPEAFRQARGPELMDAVRTVVEEMEHAEAVATVRWREDAQHAGQQTSGAIVMAAVLSAGFITAGAIATARARRSRERAENELTVTTGRLSEAQKLARMGGWEFPAGRRDEEWWSEEAYRLFGLEPQAAPVRGDWFQSMLHPDDRARVRAAVDAVLAGGDAMQLEYRIRRADGTERWIRDAIRAVRDAGGAIERVQGVMQDITDEKLAQLALQARDERWSFALENSAQGVWDWDDNRPEMYFSPVWKKLFGYEEWDNRLLSDWQARVHPADLPLVLEKLRQHQSGETPFFEHEYRVRRGDGRYVWILDRARIMARHPDGRASRMIGTHTDISSRKATELALRDSEERLSTIYHAMAEGLVVYDRSGVVTACNPAAERILGLSREAMLGRTTQHQDWRTVRSDGSPLPGEEHPAQRALATGESIRSVELGIEPTGGQRRWISLNAEPVRNGLGVVESVVVSFTDITARKRAEEILAESEERFRALALRVPVGIFETDPEGACLYVNDRWCEITGLARDQALGDGWARALHPRDAPKVTRWWREFTLSRGDFVHEYRFQRPNGETAWVAGQALWLRDRSGKPTGCIGTITDISEHRRLLADLETTRDQALDASRMKSEFLANMSHEIRTPMNGIIGMTELLLEARLEPAQREMAQVVLRSAENLLTIINDILDFSKIEAGKLTIEAREFDLRQLVDGTVALLGPRAAAKGVCMSCDFSPDAPRTLRGDAVRVRQVLTNLLGNAVKFTDAGEIVVTVRRVHDEAGRASIRLEVRDTGPGIPAEQQGRLFQAFVQADGTTTRRHGGTGLGLAISRQLVQLMGGRIGFTSEEGKGSVFWFELALPAPGAEPVPPPPRGPAPRSAGLPAWRVMPAPAAKHCRFLLVEDNPSNQVVARALLEQLGHSCVIAADGAEAISLLAQQPFDAVLMDCQMPVKDGYTTTREIRTGAVPGKESIPVIALTAYAMAEDRAKCLAAGMDYYLSKPLRAADLAAAFEVCGLVPPSEASRSETVANEASARGAAVLDEAQLAQVREIPGRSKPRLLDELADLLSSTAPVLLDELQDAAVVRDTDKLEHHAHRLAGSSAHLGAFAMRSAALALEAAARKRDWPAVTRHLDTLRAEWERVREALGRL